MPVLHASLVCRWFNKYLDDLHLSKHRAYYMLSTRESLNVTASLEEFEECDIQVLSSSGSPWSHPCRYTPMALMSGDLELFMGGR